ncbi:MAG: DUF1294 domain-containing protein [Clostridia bacterium]|nr:DUF1294 domain-containing protein [Clostridia bacterium]
MDSFGCPFLVVMIYYIVLINLITFLVFGMDKLKAKKGLYRVPEKVLFLLALVGGSVGAIIAMICFRHKTRHKTFTIGIPLILLAQIAVTVL